VPWQKQSGKASFWRNPISAWKWKATSISRLTPSNGSISNPARLTPVVPGKGTASYYDLEVNGKRNQGAAWYYPDPKPEAKQIKGYVAFWKGVKVEK
jgi:Domain of unknown function (DUF427)